MELQIHEEKKSKSCIVLAVEGRLNAVSALKLKEHIKKLVSSKINQIIIDLTNVTFIDSSGLAALVSGLKVTREAKGFFKLAGLNQQTITVLKITRLDRVFEIYDDTDSALASMSEYNQSNAIQ